MQKHLNHFFRTCSALSIQLGSKGITGNMYSNGYNKDDIAKIVIVRAL